MSARPAAPHPGLAPLARVERAISGILQAGLANARAEIQALPALADELETLRFGNLAQTLRVAAQADEPAQQFDALVTAWAMLDKLRQRLGTLPMVDRGAALPLRPDGQSLLARPDEPVPGAVDGWLGWLAGPAADRRAWAAERLAAAGSQAVPGLAQLAERGTRRVRQQALTLLGRIGGAEAATAIAAQVGAAPIERAALAAALAVGPAMVEPLVARLPGRPRVEQRQAVAQALYRLEARDALRPLRLDKDALVRAWATAHEPPTWREEVVAGLRDLAGGPLAMPELFEVQSLVPALLYAERSDLETLFHVLNKVESKDLEAASALLRCGPAEGVLVEFCLTLLGRAGIAQPARNRAVTILAGLASPLAAAPLAVLHAGGRLSADQTVRLWAASGDEVSLACLAELAASPKAGRTAERALRSLG